LKQMKTTAGRIIGPRLLQTGRVLGIRGWEPPGVIEIDLHLPATDMAHWAEIPYIKIMVGDLTFRDYSPAGWDAETSTCTIYVDVAHKGPGSTWATGLAVNEAIHYLKISSTRQKVRPGKPTVCLGDETSIGHMLAARQMAPPGSPFSGAILINDPDHHRLFNEYFRSPLQPILKKGTCGATMLYDWVVQQKYDLKDTVFLITGNHGMTGRLRKLLRQAGYAADHVAAHGFWS